MRYEFHQGKRYRVLIVLDNFLGRVATERSIENRLSDWGLQGSATKHGPGNFTVEGVWTISTRTVSHDAIRKVTPC